MDFNFNSTLELTSEQGPSNPNITNDYDFSQNLIGNDDCFVEDILSNRFM